MRAIFAVAVLWCALASSAVAQEAQCRTAPVGTVSSNCASEAMVTQSMRAPIIAKQAFSGLPACGTSSEGALAGVTDSTTVTWGATITGGGSNHVLGYCDGTNWTVAAK